MPIQPYTYVCYVPRRPAEDVLSKATRVTCIHEQSRTSNNNDDDEVLATNLLADAVWPPRHSLKNHQQHSEKTLRFKTQMTSLKIAELLKHSQNAPLILWPVDFCSLARRWWWQQMGSEPNRRRFKKDATYPTKLFLMIENWITFTYYSWLWFFVIHVDQYIFWVLKFS